MWAGARSSARREAQSHSLTRLLCWATSAGDRSRSGHPSTCRLVLVVDLTPSHPPAVAVRCGSGSKRESRNSDDHDHRRQEEEAPDAASTDGRPGYKQRDPSPMAHGIP